MKMWLYYLISKPKHHFLYLDKDNKLEMSDKLLIELPKELVDIAGISKKEINSYNLEIWVFNLYAKGNISVSRASQLLGLKIDIFMNKFRETHLKRLGGPIDIDEANNDADTLSSVFNQWTPQ